MSLLQDVHDLQADVKHLMKRERDTRARLEAVEEENRMFKELLGLEASKKKGRSPHSPPPRRGGGRRERRERGTKRSRSQSPAPLRAGGEEKKKRESARNYNQGHSVYLKFPRGSTKSFKQIGRLENIFKKYGPIHRVWVFADEQVGAHVGRVQFEDEASLNRCVMDESAILKEYDLYLTTEQGYWRREEREEQATRLVQSYSPEEGEINESDASC